MSLGDIFGCIFSQTGQIWTKLGREMGMGKDRFYEVFGKIASGAPKKGAKYQPFS